MSREDKGEDVNEAARGQDEPEGDFRNGEVDTLSEGDVRSGVEDTPTFTGKTEHGAGRVEPEGTLDGGTDELWQLSDNPGAT